MAVGTPTIVGSSAYSQVWSFASDGAGGGFAPISKATLLANASPGPLKNLLAQTFTDAQWVDLVAGATQPPPISIYVINQEGAGLPNAIAAHWYVSEGSQIVEVALAAVNAIGRLTIKFNDSFDR